MDIRPAHWQQYRTTLLDIRHEVFVHEQGVPLELEEDEQDADALHLLVDIDGHAAGCARLLSDGHFGRVAVRARFRNQGVGARLLKAVEQLALQQGITTLRAAMQCNAAGFYLDHGFEASVGIFLDAGIPHVHIHKHLSSATPVSSLYRLRQDRELHHLSEGWGAAGFLQLLMAQRPAALDLATANSEQPIWTDNSTAPGLSLLIRAQRRTQIRILLRQDHPHLLAHPLVRLAQRMSSRIQLRIQPELQLNAVVATPNAWICDRSIRNLNGPANPEFMTASLANPAGFQSLSEHFNRLWLDGHNSDELQQRVL